ncbi:hypothetical protein ONA70_28060 [Micromonospora yasonensis]|uniref:hypothetical protein n=1 Tax=Micromonospora yasonensis TaxID=1128667 RepID=UPI00222F0715|nr:hypothetical protein [Micromonospora yasonensis]MCW3843951.1 hypothetical protein [Micromonospora yasonensis]
MPGAGTGQGEQQVRWARRENDRRQQAYEAAAEAWRRREDQLVRLRIEAAGFLGCTEPRRGLPVEFADDEVVYRVLPTAELVEAQARHLSGLPPPALALATTPVDAPGRPLPAGLRVVDAGMVVVTNLRVAFAGRAGRREWAHADLRGPGHHADIPITLLHTADGRRPAGLRVPPTAAVNFRFYLTLAFATATGERAAVARQIDTLLAAHRDARPMPPSPVVPAAAPAPLLRPERRAAAAAVALAVAIGALATGAVNAPADVPPYRAEPEASGVAASPDGRAVFGGGFPSTPANPTDGESPSPTVATTTRPTGGGSEVDGPIRRDVRAGNPSAAPVAVPPAPARTADARPTIVAPPATTPPPQATPAPSGPPSSADPPVVVLCLQPLQLPLVGSLLCPGP